MEGVLRLLSGEVFRTTEELSCLLGSSCVAVRKMLQDLEVHGLRIESSSEKGYRLAIDADLLDREVIYSGVDRNIRDYVFLQSSIVVESTNDAVCELAAQETGKKIYCCTAEHQICGRGRRGRAWLTPFGGAVCLSLLWKVPDGAASLEGLSLAVGVAVIQALEFCGVGGLGLRWPNDILWEHKKLAGVLLEMHGNPAGECDIVIGIGVNVSLNRDQIDSISQPATDIRRACGALLSRNHIISAMINKLYYMLEDYRVGGFSLFREVWGRYDVYRGKAVEFDVAGGRISGRFMGVSDQGRGVLETEVGPMIIRGGEVELSSCGAMNEPKLYFNSVNNDKQIFFECSNNVLELDAGNTRLKWRLLRNGFAVDEGCLADQSMWYAQLPKLLDDVGEVDFVRASVVSGSKRKQLLRSVISDDFGLDVRFAYTRKSWRGLTVAYDESGEFGVDRWLAMLAAHCQYPDCVKVIVDLGTALTLDIVSGGYHLGGFIVPGLGVMRRSLLMNATGLNVTGGYVAKNSLGRVTSDCVENGILSMAVALVNTQAQKYPDSLVFLTGGDAEKVESYIENQKLYKPNLVMDGLRLAFL